MPGEQRSQTASPRTPGGRTTPVLVPQGALAGQPDVPLDRPVTTVGSNEQARLHLVSRTVSKGHALFVNSGGSTYVADMASRTGVLVNGKLVRDAELKTGDRVQIGKFVFRYRSPANTAPPPPQPLPPPAAVIVVGSPAIEVERRAVIIGRRETSDIPLPGDSAVSAAHSVIFQMDGKWFIRDLASRSGTQVNGKGIHQQELKFGDRIGIGSSTILFQPAARAAEASADLEDSGIVQITSKAPVDIEEDIERLPPVPVDAESSDEPVPLVDWKSAFPVEPAGTGAGDAIENPQPSAESEPLDDFENPLEELPGVEAEPAVGAEPAPVPAELDGLEIPLEEAPGAKEKPAWSKSTQPAAAALSPSELDEAFADFALEEENAASAASEPAVAQTTEIPLEIKPAPAPPGIPGGVEEDFENFALADEQPAEAATAVLPAMNSAPLVEQPPVTERAETPIAAEPPAVVVRAEAPIDVAPTPVPMPVEAPVESIHEAEEAARFEETQESAVAEAAELEAVVSEAARLMTEGPAITSEPASSAPPAVARDTAVAPPPAQAETPKQEPAVTAPAGGEPAAQAPAAAAARSAPSAAPPVPPAVPASLLADVDDFVFVPADEPIDPKVVPDVIFWGDSEADASAEQAVEPPAPASPPVDESKKKADDEPLDDDGPPPPAPPPTIPPGSSGSSAAPRPDPAAQPARKPAPVRAPLPQALEDPIDFGSGEAAASAAAQPLGIAAVEPTTEATEVAPNVALGGGPAGDITVAAEDEYSVSISEGLEAAFQVASSLPDASPSVAGPSDSGQALSGPDEQVEPSAEAAPHAGQTITATTNIPDEPQVEPLTSEEIAEGIAEDVHDFPSAAIEPEAESAWEKLDLNLQDLEEFADAAPDDEHGSHLVNDATGPEGLPEPAGEQVDCSVAEETTVASPDTDDFNFEQFPQVPSETESADWLERAFATESDESSVSESPQAVDIAGITNTAAAQDEADLESVIAAVSFAAPLEPGAQEIETNELDLDFLEPGESPAQASSTDPSAAVEPRPEAVAEKPEAPAAGASTPHEQPPQLGEDATESAPAPEEPSGSEPAPGQVKPAAPRRGPTLFGFEFEGGSFLGGMPISLAGSSPVAAPPPAPPRPAAPAPPRAFDSRLTPPSGLGAMLESSATAPPAPAALPPRQRPKAPPAKNRSAKNRPVTMPGLISDARSPSGPPAIPPTGKQPAGRSGLTGAPRGSGLGLRNTDVFSQMTSPIGVEVFGGRPGNPDQFTVPEFEKPTGQGADQESSAPQVATDHELVDETAPDAGAQAAGTAVESLEYAAAKSASRLRWSRLTVFASLMLLIPALAWATLHFAVSENTTYSGYLNFAGIGGQSPEELHEFINKQNYMLLHDDDVRVRADQILENNHQPPGFTANPDLYAQYVQTQNLNWDPDGNQLQLTLGWPDAVQGKALVNAVLRALADQDEYLNQAKAQAHHDADDARAKVDALNATRAKLDDEHKSLADKAADKPDRVSIDDANQQVIQLSQELKNVVLERTARETELAGLKAQDPTKPIDPEQDKEIVDLKSRLQPLNDGIQIAKRKAKAAGSDARVAGAAVSADGATQGGAAAGPLLAALQQQADSLNSQIQRRREELAVESAIPPEQRKVNQESAIENLSVKITSLSKSEKDLGDQLKTATDKANQNQARVEAAQIAEAQKEDVYRQMQDTVQQLQSASNTSRDKETAYANCITVAETPHNPMVQYVSTTDLRKRILLGVSVLTGVVLILLILGELRRPRPMTSVRPAAAPRVAPPPMRVIPWPQPQQALGMEDPVGPQPQMNADPEHAVLF